MLYNHIFPIFLSSHVRPLPLLGLCGPGSGSLLELLLPVAPHVAYHVGPARHIQQCHEVGGIVQCVGLLPSISVKSPDLQALSRDARGI